MKKLLSILAVFSAFLILQVHADESGSVPKKRLKVLGIGNSFTVSLKDYFVPVVESAGCEVDIEYIYIGGCPLKKHWNNIEKEETDPDFKYFKNKNASGEIIASYSYKDKLLSKKWDIVTIQQASHDSWKYETYMPYAKNLYDYIKKHAPQAEVMIQQTWSYRFDDNRLTTWKIDQNEMFNKLFEAYNKTAKELNITVIPVGSAVQLVRETQPNKLKHFNRADFKYPDIPELTGSLIGNIKWSKDKTKLEGDAFHLNQRGKYLQACVWFGIIFNIDPRECTAFQPSAISVDDAKFLREAAAKTVSEFKQVKE